MTSQPSRQHPSSKVGEHGGPVCDRYLLVFVVACVVVRRYNMKNINDTTAAFPYTYVEHNCIRLI